MLAASLSLALGAADQYGRVVAQCNGLRSGIGFGLPLKRKLQRD